MHTSLDRVIWRFIFFNFCEFSNPLRGAVCWGARLLSETLQKFTKSCFLFEYYKSWRDVERKTFLMHWTASQNASGIAQLVKRHASCRMVACMNRIWFDTRTGQTNRSILGKTQLISWRPSERSTKAPEQTKNRCYTAGLLFCYTATNFQILVNLFKMLRFWPNVNFPDCIIRLQ